MSNDSDTSDDAESTTEYDNDTGHDHDHDHEHDHTQNENEHTLARRGALTLLSAGLGGLVLPSASARSGNGTGDQPWHTWDTDVNANGNQVRNLGGLSTTTNDTPLSDFAGQNLSIDQEGVLNAEGLPDSIHIANEYPGETLDQKLRAILDELRGTQPGHRIVVAPPDPDEPGAAGDGPYWRFEEPVVFDDNTGKLVLDMGWTIAFATAPIESFFVIGPDAKTENIVLDGGFFYAKGNLSRSFVDIQGVGHMHIYRMYLQSLSERNSVPAGIRLADKHGTSELSIYDTEVTGCTDAFYATQAADVPYGAAFDLDMYNWRGGGGETSIRIDGGVGINLHSIQTGGHPLQSVSDSIVKLENSTNAVRKANISFVRERHNAMDFRSGVRVADVTDGEGDQHDGVYIQNVDCYNADYGTDIEYVTNFDQQNIRPAPTVANSAAGSTRWFDDGIQRHGTDRSHAFHAGNGPSFVVEEDDVRVLSPGNGTVLTTPDGSSQYRIRVDNDGNLVTEQVDKSGNDQ